MVAEVPAPAGTAAILQPGVVLAGRYEIVRLLGEGGMGAVYQARDYELERLVALKVIRPELANHPATLRRFKQELILARQISHRNVIRIFDLGAADGVRFISMEFVDGRDLATWLEEQGKLSPAEAADVVVQILNGLEAAHAEGVVHRDLKPRNIMVSPQGKITVMDFGIARSADAAGLTRTGALVGTPEYMSPEQARGAPVDARSDLFSLGIILYELLTGIRPFQADNPMASLLKRVQEDARPPLELDPAIPAKLSQIAVKSLARDPDARYQSAREMRQAIEEWQGVAAAPPAAGAKPAPRVGRRSAIAAGVAALAVLAVLGVWYRQTAASRQATPRKTVSILIADFTNSTFDKVLDQTLESALALALEGAPFINLSDRAEASRVAGQLRAGVTALDEQVARLVALRQGIGVVVAGSIAPRSSGYLLSARTLDAVTGNVLLSQEVEIAGKQAVLGGVSRLGVSIRRVLGDATPESQQLAAAETFTASSLAAAHSYAVAQELARKGEWEEAVRTYREAVDQQPDLGRAYAGIAVASANLGNRQEAEKNYQFAMARLDRMTDREKYRTRGGYYLMMRNHQKAIEEFTALIKQFPADSAALNDLALAHFYQRDMNRALEDGRQALSIYPNSVLKRINVGLYAMYAGDFAAAAQELRRVVEQNPTYAKARLALGMCELAQGHVAQAAEIYQLLEGLPGQGPSFAALAQADLALYEGRLRDAIAILEKGIARDIADGKPPAANKLAALAEAHLLARRPLPAVSAADRATAAGRQESALFPAARVYVETGQEAKAAAIAEELEKRMEPEPRACAKLIRGEIRLKHADTPAALDLFLEAQRLADSWEGRLSLARAYLEAGKFTEAHSELETCLKRRGEATALFLDDMPTLRRLPSIYYFLGRAEQGLKNSSAAASFRTFLSAKKSDEDPWVADARRRAGQ